MAQIIISTIDPENGAVNVSVKFKDSDLQRIYNAYKHNYAAKILKTKTDAGEVLEASDTIENIISDIDSYTVLIGFIERFVKDLIHITYGVEQKIILEKNPLAQIEYDL